MGVVVRRVNGILGLVEATLRIVGELRPGGFLWFRGVTRSTHTLLPKIMRDGKDAEAIFERERRLLTRFRQRSLAYWPAGYPQDDWEHLFAMQHYGAPTRLLDWTENLFVAAYFAFETPSGGADELPAIWCMDPVAWNRATPVLAEYGETIHVLTTADDDADAYRPATEKRRNKSPVALFGTHNSQRIVAQRGTFIVWGNSPRPLEEFANEMNVTIWKLEVEGGRATLANALRSLGFGETMVFPEMPTLAVELTRAEGWRP